MTKDYEEHSNLLAEKDIHLVLGATGAGKTTLIHQLCGSKMRRDTYMTKQKVILPHLRYDSSELREDLAEQLKDLYTSPEAHSITQFVKPIKIDHNDTNLLLVDSPGFSDLRGPEIEVANALGLAQAIKKCRSVVPVIVLSANQEGDRMSGFKRFIQDLSKMFKNMTGKLGKVKFIFNKYINRENSLDPFSSEDYKNTARALLNRLKDSHENFNESDQGDTMLKEFYKAIIAEAHPDNILLADPFNGAGRSTILG